MSTSKLFDDFAKMASGALGTADAMRHEFEAAMRERFERWCKDNNLVTREDHDVLKDMLTAARNDNEELKARVAALEAKVFGHAEPAGKN